MSSLDRADFATRNPAPELYEPNYLSFPSVRRWVHEGLLSDPNVGARSLAGQIRGEVRSEGELASAAKVLLSRGQSQEAVQLYRVNCQLYPESSRAFARLAGALGRTAYSASSASSDWPGLPSSKRSVISCRNFSTSGASEVSSSLPCPDSTRS